jgi:hypothetical protein
LGCLDHDLEIACAFSLASNRADRPLRISSGRNHGAAARRAIFHFRFTPIVREQLVRSRAFRTKISLADRTLRIAFDRNQFPILVINELPASNSAIRTNRARNLRVIDACMHRTRFVGHRLKAGAVGALTNLTDERSFGEKTERRVHLIRFRPCLQLSLEKFAREGTRTPKDCSTRS